MNEINPATESAGINDFPFYKGQPIRLTGGQWILVMIGVAVGFLVLIFGLDVFKGVLAGFLPVALYVAIPLAALAFVSGRHWTSLFRKVRGRDFLLMAAFALLNLVVTLGVGALLVRHTETTTNPALAALGDHEAWQLAFFYLRAIPQLIGEEVMTILAFFGVLPVTTFWTFLREFSPLGAHPGANQRAPIGRDSESVGSVLAETVRILAISRPSLRTRDSGATTSKRHNSRRQ